MLAIKVIVFERQVGSRNLSGADLRRNDAKCQHEVPRSHEKNGRWNSLLAREDARSLSSFCSRERIVDSFATR